MSISPGDIQLLYPIGAIALYKNATIATVLRYGNPAVRAPRQKRTKRGKIENLSQKSLNRLLFLTQVTTIELKSMLTLTYLCPPANGRKAKRDLRRVLSWIRRRKREECDYVWFAEFTVAGSIHFHVLLSCSPSCNDRRDLAYYWLKKTDQGQGAYCDLKRKRLMRVAASIFSVNSHPKTWEDIRSHRGAARYVAQYACKPHQKEIPSWYRDMGRYWGVSKGVKKNQEKPTLIELTEDELREVLRRNEHKCSSWDVIPKYLWAVDQSAFDGIN